MSYGPGYTMWKEILRQREERRIARLQAKRQAAAASSAPSASAASPPTAPTPAVPVRRGRRTLGIPRDNVERGRSGRGKPA